MPREKKEEKTAECCHPHRRHYPGGDTGGAIYFFSIIGAAVYNIQHVNGFWPIVLAILKAIVWPAFLMHKVFGLLQM